MKRARRKSPVKHASSSVVDLVEAEEQTAMAERFERDRIKLDQDLVDAKRALEVEHARQLALLESRKLAALAQLWRRQGRQLGPGMLRALGEAQGWNGAGHGTA
jgi:hypothetical protein